jgi:hypothetical protein
MRVAVISKENPGHALRGGRGYEKRNGGARERSHLRAENRSHLFFKIKNRKQYPLSVLSTQDIPTRSPEPADPRWDHRAQQSAYK